MDNYSDFRTRHINYALNGKVMLCTGVLLFIVLFILLCFHNYAPFFFGNRRRRYLRRRRAQHLLSISAAITPPPSAAAASEVCLSEFENDEKARVLPNCNHSFHVDCIDMWFYTHSNCPLCRAPVRVDVPVNPPKTLEQVAVTVSEPAGSEPPITDIEMSSPSATASSSSSSSSLKMESCPMKRLELVGVGILVEVPPGENRLTGGADAGSGNRILSLKRIWSA
ncbi:hypothetical protein ERO13_A11G113700v2 [Gossypium hirsutum]|uniref:RING-type E3 ubiquitin transferase n=1 Tax=Gossypium hirsutum TaxID=3635 RepID=A0A1U8IE47_GOSHI|nr:RING-H2 finger protein ATL5-like [Gossypium hirsutum]KAG4174320.1 hypothetical protein ERO13_A11G113700v2 [Gossypium hirsutum]